MSRYMVMVYDCSFVQDYIRDDTPIFDDREEAIEYAINLTNDFIDNGIDYLCADVFIEFGMGTPDWSMIGEVTYTLEWDGNPYDSVEFEECFS